MSQDGTNFGNRHVQGAIASFHSFVAMTEKDIFGSPLGWVRGVKRVALPLVHGLNKISKDVKRKDGTVHTPVTPEALAMIVYFTGLMVIFSHYAEILTLSFDGASENGHLGQGGEAMCGHNSQMDCLMIRHSIWKEVESKAEKLGLKDFLISFYKNENPEELLSQLRELLRKERKEKREAGRARKAKKGRCEPAMSHANEPDGDAMRQEVPAECAAAGRSGCSYEVEARGTEAQEQAHADSNIAMQGVEPAANTAGGRDPECTASGVSGCCDGNGAGADSNSLPNRHDSHSISHQHEDGAGEDESDYDSDSSSSCHSSGDTSQNAEGSGEPAGPATPQDVRFKRLIGLPAPDPRQPPQALNTQGPVKPSCKLKDNDERNEDGVAEKFDYEDAVDEVRDRHAFLRFWFQEWYILAPPTFKNLKMDQVYTSRMKKYTDQTKVAVAAAVAAAADAGEADPLVGGGGVFWNLIRNMRDKLAEGINLLRQKLLEFTDNEALSKIDGNIPSDVDNPAGAAAAAAGVDPARRGADSAAAATAAAAAANSRKARLAQAVFRYRLSNTRKKSYEKQRTKLTKLEYWDESKSARFETRRNPLMYYACIDQRTSGGDPAWCKMCTAVHCMHHRLHNATKRFFLCLNNGLFQQYQAALGCIKNLYIWSALKTAIDLILACKTEHEAARMESVDTEFYEHVQNQIQANYLSKKGVSLDDVRKEVDYDPVQGIREPKTCIEIRWGTVANAASHLLSHRRLYLFGMIRRFSKCIDDPHVAASVSVFSDKGFVSDEYGNVNIDDQVQRAFGLLSKVPELAQLAIVNFVNIVCIQPMLNGASSDNDCAVDEMMGVDSIPRRMIYLFERGLWLRTGMRGWHSKLAVLSRTDGGEFDPDPKSVHILDVNCDVNSILGSAGNEKTSGAVKELLKNFKMLASSGQEVMPDDLLSAFTKARQARAKLARRARSELEQRDDTYEKGDEHSFASNMSKLMYIFNLVCADVVESLRCEFDREIFGIQGLIGGMIKQLRSTIINGDGVRCDIVTAHPIALANALVLLVLAMDLAAHHHEELRNHDAVIENFTPSYAQVISKDCMDENKQFLGMQPGLCRRVEEVSLAPESFTLNKRFNTYEKRINGETAELSSPLFWYPKLLNWSITAQCSCPSSKACEQTFSTPSLLGRGKAHSSFRAVNGRFRMHSISSCGLDIRKTKSIQYQLARKFAKLRAWSHVFEEDKIKGDAMAANYMHQKLPSYVKNGGDWKTKSHEKSCRPDRFVDPPDGSKEQGYVEKLTERLFKRIGVEYEAPLKPSKKIRRTAKRSGLSTSLGKSKALKSQAGSSAPVVSAAARAQQAGGGGSHKRDETQVLEAADASASAESGGADQRDQIHPGSSSSNVQFSPAGSFSGSAGALDLLEEGTSAEVDMSASLDCASPGVGSMAPAGSGGPAASEGPPAASSRDEHGGEQCETGDAELIHQSAARADETDQGPPGNVTEAALLPSAGSESLADSVGGGGAPEETKDADDDKSEVSVNGEFGSRWSINFCFKIHNKIWKDGSEHRTWKVSRVYYQEDLGGLYASMTRVRGFRCKFQTEIKFNVKVNSSRYHYIMYDQWAGGKLVHVTGLQRPGDGEDWEETVEYRRVYTSKEAANITDIKNGGERGFLGRKALQELAAADQLNRRTTYHVGDCLYRGDIRDMIGVIRWAVTTCREEDLSGALYSEHKKADLIYIGPHVSERVR